MALTVNVARFIYAQFTPAHGGKGVCGTVQQLAADGVDEVDSVDEVDRVSGGELSREKWRCRATIYRPLLRPLSPQSPPRPQAGLSSLHVRTVCVAF